MAKEGFDVTLVADGQEAIDRLKTFVPDVMLLDLMMPKKDGFTVLEEIQNNPDWKRIPVIIASNLGQKEDIDRGMKLGARDYIIKSDISINDVITKINTVIGT